MPLYSGQVEYLGHLITPQWLKTNPQLVFAVQEFPVPCNLHEVVQCLGLSSYYRTFIPPFSKVAQPLHGSSLPDSLSDTEAETGAVSSLGIPIV